jgi:hypothetical protein
METEPTPEEPKQTPQVDASVSEDIQDWLKSRLLKKGFSEGEIAECRSMEEARALLGSKKDN